LAANAAGCHSVEHFYQPSVQHVICSKTQNMCIGCVSLCGHCVSLGFNTSVHAGYKVP